MDNKERLNLLLTRLFTKNGQPLSEMPGEIADAIAAANLLAPENLVRIGHISVDQNNVGKVVYEFCQGPIEEGMPVFVSLVIPVKES